MFRAMRSVYEQRRDNLRELMRSWGGPTSMAKKLGHSNGSYLAQLAGPNPSREVSEKVAREIEGKLGLPLGWMDVEHDRRAPVDDTALAECVRVLKTSRDLRADLRGKRGREGHPAIAAALAQIPQRRAAHVLHRQVERVAVLSEVEDLHHVRVVQLRDRGRARQRSFATEGWTLLDVLHHAARIEGLRGEARADADRRHDARCRQGPAKLA